MRSYQEHLGNQVHFYLASINNENQGCAVLISDGVGSYFIHGGSRVGAHHGAVALLHWEAMLDMKKKGLRVYDFIGGRINPIPGSKQEGIQN